MFCQRTLLACDNTFLAFLQKITQSVCILPEQYVLETIFEIHHVNRVNQANVIT